MMTGRQSRAEIGREAQLDTLGATASPSSAPPGSPHLQGRIFWNARRAIRPSRAADGKFWAAAGLHVGRAAARNEMLVDDFLTKPFTGLPMGKIRQASDEMLEAVAREGVGAWIEAVRRHHDATYQHCLLVNGITAAFSLSLGLSTRDQYRMVQAAMLHDIGKVKIPLGILDSPSRLTEEEQAIMRLHPSTAIEMLEGHNEVDADVLDAIEHHHENLDGSGYPHRLQGPAIRDFTRLIAIADRFAALVERRAYKQDMTAMAAFDLLLRTEGELDRDLLRAFRPVALASGRP